MFERKLKSFKKLTKFAQNMRFSRLRQVACKSPGPAARTLRRTLWKKFLSVFHDWKFHLRESRELCCKNLCVPLATRPSTHEQVANLSREKHEILNFEKYSKSFSRLKHLLANESLVSCEKSLCWTRNWACDWFYLRLSRQNRAIQFLKFLTIFAKTKYFPKTTKNSKIFL